MLEEAGYLWTYIRWPRRRTLAGERPLTPQTPPGCPGLPSHGHLQSQATRETEQSCAQVPFPHAPRTCSPDLSAAEAEPFGPLVGQQPLTSHSSKGESRGHVALGQKLTLADRSAGRQDRVLVRAQRLDRPERVWWIQGCRGTQGPGQDQDPSCSRAETSRSGHQELCQVGSE